MKKLIVCMMMIVPVLTAAEQMMMEFYVVTVPDSAPLEKPLRQLGKITLEQRERLLKMEGVDVLSAPKLIAREGEDASIFIGHDELEYMERQGDYFQLKKLNEDVGIRVQVNCRSTGKAGALMLKGMYSMNLLEDRESVSGVALFIGKPVIAKSTVAIEVVLEEYVWHVVGVVDVKARERDDPDTVFVLCRAFRVDKEGNMLKDMPFEVEADNVQTRKDGSSVFIGDVRVVHGEHVILADRLTVRKTGEADGKTRIVGAKVSFAHAGEALLLEDGEISMEGYTLAAEKLRLESPLEKGPVDALEKKLRSLIVPNLNFQDASLEDALRFLSQTARELDPDEKGVNVVVDAAVKKGATLTISLSNVPLWDALRYVTEVAGLGMEVQEHAVLITDK